MNEFSIEVASASAVFAAIFFSAILWNIGIKDIKATAAWFFKGLGKIIVYALLAALVIGVLSLVVWGWIAIIAAGPVVVLLALIWATLLMRN